MPFSEDQDVIQAVAPQRPDQPLNIWISATAIAVRLGGLESPLLGAAL
jgi:hypothetical protein